MTILPFTSMPCRVELARSRRGRRSSRRRAAPVTSPIDGVRVVGRQLLGGLAGRRVLRRVPARPACRVLRRRGELEIARLRRRKEDVEALDAVSNPHDLNSSAMNSAFSLSYGDPTWCGRAARRSSQPLRFPGWIALSNRLSSSSRRKRRLRRSPSPPAASAHGRPPWTRPRPTRGPEFSFPLSASVVSLTRVPARRSEGV